jgi:hypothetical protein
MAMKEAGTKQSWCSILPEELSDWHTLFYTGIENIHQEYVDKIDRGKWALTLLEMENPETGKKTTLSDIVERVGVKKSTLQSWIEAARTAVNLEIAAEEAKESAKSIFIKLKRSESTQYIQNNKRFKFPTSREIGVGRLRFVHLVAEKPEETAKIVTVIKYKELTPEETQKFISILRDEGDKELSDEFILKTATEVKGTFMNFRISHLLRDAVADYGKKRDMNLEETIIDIL